MLTVAPLAVIAKAGLPGVDAGSGVVVEGDVVQQAVAPGLIGLLVDALERGALEPVDDGIRAQAIEAAQRVAASTLVLERRTQWACDVVASDGCGVVVLKGPAVAHLRYADPTLRPFRDVDLLVRSADLDRAVALLSAAGCARRRPEIAAGYDHRFGKAVTLVSEGGIEIDLHRTIAPGPFGLLVREADLWDDLDTFQLGAMRLRALSPTNGFVHACYHAVLGDRRPRMLALRDIAQFLLTGAVDLDRARATARRWGGEGVVAEAISTTWRGFALPDDLHPGARWARQHQPSGRHVVLRRAYGVGKPWHRQALAAAVVVPGLAARARYLWAITTPARERALSRARSRSRHWWDGAGRTGR